MQAESAKLVKTSELTGVALDWIVASAKGYSKLALTINGNTREFLSMHGEGYHNYSVDWSQADPIIERELIATLPSFESASENNNWQGAWVWKAYVLGPDNLGDNFEATGKTRIEAAMRCYVASKLGDTVEIPNELTLQQENL